MIRLSITLRVPSLDNVSVVKAPRSLLYTYERAKRRMCPLNSAGSAPLPDFDAIYAAVASFDDSAEEFERVVRRVYEAVLEPGDCALDVGAHVGKHSAPLAMSVAPGGRVLALEPIPWAFERLSRRACLAGLDSLEARHCCVGASEAEEVTFHVVPTRPGWSAKTVRPGSQTEAVLVPQTTVDRLARELGPVRFLKIDVEGAEPEVLEGAANVLATARPVVHVEVSLEALEANGFGLHVLRDQLAGHGYVILDLLGFDVTSVSAWAASASAKGLFDYVAVHPEGADLLTVAKVLSRSFLAERLDISGHGLAELLGPLSGAQTVTPRFGLPLIADTPDDCLDSEFIAGPRSASRTTWPTDAAGVGRFAIAWKGGVTGLLIDLLDGSVSPIDGAPLPTSHDGLADTLEAGSEIRIELDLAALKPNQNHQTIVEVHLLNSQTIGLCRIHKNGRLETMWIRDGKTLSVDGATFVSGPTTIIIRHLRGRWFLNATGDSGSLSSLIKANEQQVDLAVGRRRFWPNSEPVKLAHISTKISCSRVSLRSTLTSSLTAIWRQVRAKIGGNSTAHKLIGWLRSRSKFGSS